MTDNPLIGGKYEILERIGKGNMGYVYRGRNIETDEIIAIKSLKVSADEMSPEMLQRFQREGETLRQLNHPNILKVFGMFEEAKSYYMVMEFVPGGSLETLLEKERLPVTRILKLTIDITDAVARAHSLGIIHRDIKPANVLLADDGTPRLSDFGVAHTADSNLTKSGEVFGTARYLSPEMIMSSDVSPGNDTWALGVMLYEMLAGQPPFGGKTAIEVMQKVILEPIPPLKPLAPEAPDKLIDLVSHMLQKDTAKRLMDAAQIKDSLKAIMESLDEQ